MTLKGPSPAGCRRNFHLGLVQPAVSFVERASAAPAGVIAQVDSEVDGFKEGDRVAPHLFVHGRDCYFTRSGDHAQAMDLKGIIGVTMPGGFAEYFAVPARNLLRLPKEVPFDAGGLTSCAVITAVHAYRKAGLQANDTAVVLGAGGIGLLIIQLLVWAGVKTIAVSRSENSLKQATMAGAHLALSLSAVDTPDRVREFAGDEKDGADCIFELVGLAETMKAAAGFAARGGRVVVVGEEAQFPAIDTIQIAQRELQIIGSRNGGMQDAADVLDLMARGIIKPYIVKRYPLADINEAIHFLRAGQTSGRIIIDVA